MFCESVGSERTVILAAPATYPAIKGAVMQKARVALVEVCKQLEIAQEQVNDHKEVTEALKRLHSRTASLAKEAKH